MSQMLQKRLSESNAKKREKRREERRAKKQLEFAQPPPPAAKNNGTATGRPWSYIGEYLNIAYLVRQQVKYEYCI